MRTFLASVALIIGVGISGMAHAADCSPLQIRNTVKMEPIARTGLMMVPITLDGQEKKFLFNTSAYLNQISRATAQELQLNEHHSRFHIADPRQHDTESFVQVGDVTFGQAKTKDIQFEIALNPAAGTTAPFAGMLSTGIFTHEDIDMDFGAERLNFFSTDHCDGKVVYWPHQVLAVVPMVMEQGHIDLAVTLDGQPLRASLDTGASRTVLNLQRAQELMGFSPDAAGPPANFKDDPGNKVYPRRFASLSFEGVTVANPVITVRPVVYGGGPGVDQPGDDLRLGSRAEHKDDIITRLAPDLHIGMDVLRHLHIYVATGENKLYITEATPGESVLFKPPSPTQ
jgi:predicted aspartyl protease